MKIFLKKALVAILLIKASLLSHNIYAQCGAGTTQVAVNFDWQYFDTMPTGNFRFMLGKSSLQMKWTGTTNTFLGATTINNHSGESGSYGVGNDLKFLKSNNVSDTLLFQDSVQNLQFSIYDLDNSQGLAVTATNSAGTAQNITMAKVSGTIITISGSGGTTPTATTTNTNAANSATTGTVNVSISGWVSKVVLQYTKTTSGSTADTIFMSDISACLPNGISNWTANYQSASTPEAGQPTYTLATYNNNIYVVNLTNNTSGILYTDGAFSSINSLAYDPNRQIIYYTNNARNNTNKSIYKYDVKTATKSTFVSDVTTLGIQLKAASGSFLGSAGASYYDGALYIGTDANNTIGDAVTTYRIDIDSATGTAIRASRFWSATALPTLSVRYFDWSDFVIKNGIAYCFNQSIPSPAHLGVFHMSMNLQDTLVGYTTATRSQVSMDYNENIYHMGNYGSVESYNAAGGFSSLGSYTRVNTADSLITDGAESFKYPYDYGKDTANYGVAFNLFRASPNLYLGSTVNYAAANRLDNVTSDNDGVSSFPEITVANASYSSNISLSNTTGSSAVLYGYIDFNGDGDFNDPGEKSDPVTVVNGATSATVTWTGLTGGQVGPTMVRFRLAPTDAEAGSPSGYGSNGETEDYGISIGASSLPVELIRFTGKKTEANTVQLDWSTASEFNNDYFEIHRSRDFNKWEIIGQVKGNGNSKRLLNYTFTDKNPNTGNNYYRLKQVDFDKQSKMSQVINIKMPEENETNGLSSTSFVLYPNPVQEELWIRAEKYFSEGKVETVEVYNQYGDMIYTAPLSGNMHEVDMRGLASGLYLVKLGTRAYKIFKN